MQVGGSATSYAFHKSIHLTSAATTIRALHVKRLQARLATPRAPPNCAWWASSKICTRLNPGRLLRQLLLCQATLLQQSQLTSKAKSSATTELLRKAIRKLLAATREAPTVMAHGPNPRRYAMGSDCRGHRARLHRFGEDRCVSIPQACGRGVRRGTEDLQSSPTHVVLHPVSVTRARLGLPSMLVRPWYASSRWVTESRS